MADDQQKVNLPPRPTEFEYMCISIHGPDTIFLINDSDYEAAVVRRTIREAWPRGIQRETFELNGVYEFKLNGYPFLSGTSKNDAIACRRMAERILHRLYQGGWKLHLSSNLTQNSELTTWTFKKFQVVDVSPQPFLVVGLSSFDSLMILNGPMDLHRCFKDAIERSWPRGIQKWKYDDNEVLMIKLKGCPWCPDGEDTVHSRVILQAIINDLIPKHWHLYGNSNIRSNFNTLFFHYSLSMVRAEQPSPAHFIISFNSTNLLRVIGAPDNIVSAVRSTIHSVWTKEEESRYAESWQFTLRGSPWWASGDEAVKSRYLVKRLMEAMLAHGWSPVAAIDSSKKPSDKSSLLFRQSQPREAQFFCLSLNRTRQLWLIDAPEDIMKICKEVIKAHYVPGVSWIQQHVDNMEFALVGDPWSQWNWNHGIHARNMLCHLISTLASHGWMAVISADVSGKYEDDDKSADCPIDVDSIFFMYDPIAAAGPLSVPPPQFPYSQPYPHPPPFGFAQQDAPPPFDPPPYEAYPNQ